jgi:hypothetical protein
MLECPHERMAVARERMWDAVVECIKAVCDFLTATHARANRTAAPQVKAIAAEVAPLSTACYWASGDGKYVLVHLLCAVPWMPRVVTTATPAAHWQVRFPLTRVLGRLFETTKLQDRFLRATSGHIVRFAAMWIRNSRTPGAQPWIGPARRNPERPARGSGPPCARMTARLQLSSLVSIAIWPIAPQAT